MCASITVFHSPRPTRGTNHYEEGFGGTEAAARRYLRTRAEQYTPLRGGIDCVSADQRHCTAHGSLAKKNPAGEDTVQLEESQTSNANSLDLRLQPRDPYSDPHSHKFKILTHSGNAPHFPTRQDCEHYAPTGIPQVKDSHFGWQVPRHSMSTLIPDLVWDTP